MTITQLHPTDDPAKTYFAGRQDHAVPTGTYDEDGTEILGLSPEMSALLLIERIGDELSGRDPFPEARAWWNQLKVLARQRGVSGIHIQRLEQVLSSDERNPQALMRALNRWTPKFSPEDMIRSVFKVVPA